MTRQRTRSDETSPLEVQLPLPWEGLSAPPQAPPRMPTVRPQEVWLGLAPTEQRQVQQAFVRVVQEVLHDAAGH